MPKVSVGKDDKGGKKPLVKDGNARPKKRPYDYNKGKTMGPKLKVLKEKEDAADLRCVIIRRRIAKLINKPVKMWNPFQFWNRGFNQGIEVMAMYTTVNRTVQRMRNTFSGVALRKALGFVAGVWDHGGIQDSVEEDVEHLNNQRDKNRLRARTKKALQELVATDILRTLSVEYSLSASESKYRELLEDMENWSENARPLLERIVQKMTKDTAGILGMLTPVFLMCMAISFAVAGRNPVGQDLWTIYGNACELHKQWQQLYISGEMIIGEDTGRLLVFRGDSAASIEPALTSPLIVRLLISLMFELGIKEITEYYLKYENGIRHFRSTIASVRLRTIDMELSAAPKETFLDLFDVLECVRLLSHRQREVHAHCSGSNEIRTEVGDLDGLLAPIHPLLLYFKNGKFNTSAQTAFRSILDSSFRLLSLCGEFALSLNSLEVLDEELVRDIIPMRKLDLFNGTEDNKWAICAQTALMTTMTEAHLQICISDVYNEIVTGQFVGRLNEDGSRNTEKKSLLRI